MKLATTTWICDFLQSEQKSAKSTVRNTKMFCRNSLKRKISLKNNDLKSAKMFTGRAFLILLFFLGIIASRYHLKNQIFTLQER